MATVTLYRIPPNDHGCSGEAVTIRAITRRKGVVETVATCACGCIPRSRLAESEVVSLPGSFDGTWEQAAQLDDLNLRSDYCGAGATVVTPDTLLAGLAVRLGPSHVA